MANSMLPLLATPEALAAVLGEKRLFIADVSKPETYATGHLPGAIHVEYASLLREEPPAMGLLPDAETLGRVFSSLGLTKDHHVVAYDDAGNGRASRLLWTLEALGHPAYSLLDGGLAAWRAAGQALETTAPWPTPSRYKAEFGDTDVVVDRQAVLERLNDAGTRIVDARSPAEFRGDDVRARRGGHIPGAINLEWTALQDPANHNRLLPAETLRTLFKQCGVTPDHDIITHCQTHHRSALTYIALRYLGYPRVSGYAGSWSEWGNADDTPVETGDDRPSVSL